MRQPGLRAVAVRQMIARACALLAMLLPALDPVGFVGDHASIAIGADGLPIISYHDNTAFRQKVVKCANAFCSPFFRRR